jgi:hypothetical protein
MTDGTITVEVEHAGEGWSGDYDPDDPNDEPLLRFYVMRDGEQVDDASYCTLTVDENGNADKLAAIVLARVTAPVESGESIKKLCERLSWIDADAS